MNLSPPRTGTHPRRAALVKSTAFVLGLTVILGTASTGVGWAADPRVAVTPNAGRLADDILDPTAHARITYEGSVNIASFQQDGLLTHGNYQYVAWYRSDGRATVSRRSLPGGNWQSLELDGFLDANDSHNTISMAVTPSDNRLHIALGTHAAAQLYIRSVPGLATGNATWSSRSFEGLRRALPGASGAPTTWTYPQFELVGGRMLLTFREGGSNNGRQALLRYNDDPGGTWTFLGLFTDSTGSYTSPFGASPSRNMYPHGFTRNPVNGDLVMTFTWREQSSAWCHPGGLGNHDIGYARSSDGGRTWVNNGGTTIGTTGSADRIALSDPHVVVPIPINQGMINSEAQAFDSTGRIHVMTSQFNAADLARLGGCHTSTYTQRKQYAKPFHHWREANGTWRTMELPFYNNSAGRTKILFDAHDTAYVVLPDGRIVAATAATNWQDWRVVFQDSAVRPIAELTVDRQRLRRDGVLSVAYIEQSVNHAPSAFRVADFQTAPGQGNLPRSTVPEAAPVPYQGSAPTFPTATASSAQPNYPAPLAVDGSTSSFWVSAGTTEGAGPQPSRPETLTVNYGSARRITAVTVVPRVPFGPRALTLEARVNGAWRSLGAFNQPDATATFDVADVDADQLRLVITASYDGTKPPERTRNVQVAEVTAR
ncbi:hypothetical protein Asi02nite_39590 [Asanoa siamensis]|uniref:F5/8 type C domain-containing protein n=1 Tax=Asanoa siamensis TaxID=926357 RepID=A0ABQ4CT20_9ACTN|nr:hypothetical protein Asi02nite_39590 [Asanoa siamensis]